MAKWTDFVYYDRVKRILKPNGYFLYANLRYEEKVLNWHVQIKSMGLKLIKEEEITDNVLKAMELDRERRIYLVNSYVPAVLCKLFYNFSGLKPEAPNEIPHLDNCRYWYLSCKSVMKINRLIYPAVQLPGKLFVL